MKTKRSYILYILIISVIIFIVTAGLAGCKVIKYDDSYQVTAREGCSDFYYSHLTENQQKMYRMLYKQAEDVLYNGQEEKTLGTYNFNDYSLSREEALTVWYAFRYDASAFFIISNSYSYTPTSMTVKIAPEFQDKSARDKVLEAIGKTVEEVRQQIDGYSSSAIKFKIIYDYVIEKTNYKRDKEGRAVFDGYSYSIAGPLDGDTTTNTICQGYAHAIKYLCEVFGIDCIYVGSESREHALNIVNIDGNWYYVDATNDDDGIEDEYHFFLKGYDMDWEALCMPGDNNSDNYLRSCLPSLSRYDFNCIATSDKLIYQLNKKTVRIIGCENGITQLAPPSTIGSATVDSITTGAFKNCETLTSVELSDNIKYIYSEAFMYCNNLTSISLPSNLNYYGSQAFFGSNNIIKATMPTQAINSIRSTSLREVVINGGDSLPASAFYGCSDLTSIELPSGLKSIESKAFYNCSSLTNLVIPSSVTDLGSEVFSGCDNLLYNEFDGALYLGGSDNPYLILVKAKDTDITSCQIKEDAKFIQSSAFDGCASLTKIVIPDSITNIDSMIFSRCASLESISVAPNNAYYKSEGNCIIEKASNTLISGCKSSIIPKYVTEIGNYAFYYCLGIESVTIPSSVTSIGREAFRGCRALTSVVFENNSRLTGIGASAFYNCSSLESIEIPYGVKSIADHAFYFCSNLADVVVPNTVTQVGAFAFGRCDKLNYNEYDNALYLGNSENSYLILAKVKDEDITSCEINAKTKIILSYAFQSCNSLERLVIPSGISYIGSLAFLSCNNLTLYAQANRQPSSWEVNWDYIDGGVKVKVVWGYKAS